MSEFEEMGGDAPCWAHLFADNLTDAQVSRLPEIARGTSGINLAWSTQSDDQHLNLLVFAAGDGVAAHRNLELDVVIIGVLGEGVVIIDDEPHPLRAGDLIIAPKGTLRQTQAVSEQFAYLTCHRKRNGLQPAVIAIRS